MTEERAEYTTPETVADRLHRQEAYIAQLERTIDGYAMIQGRHAEMIEERDWRIAELEAKVRELDGALTFGRETIARLEQDNRRLRHLDAMPVDAMRRYWSGTMYDTRTNVVGYGPENYDEDEAEIGAWLATLDGDA